MEIIIKLWNKSPANQKYLIQNGLYTRLERTSQSTNPSIIKCTLKLVVEIYTGPEVLFEEETIATLNFVRRIMALYKEVDITYILLLYDC